MARPRVARNIGRLVTCRYGTTENVDFGSHAAYRVGASDQSAGGSIVFWCRLAPKSDATATNVHLVTLASGATDYITLYLQRGYDVDLRVSAVRASASVVTTTTNVMYPVGGLICVALIWDSSGIEMWINGVRVWQSAVDARPTFGATPQFVLGNWYSGSLAINGSVGGEVYLYARKLTRGEVERHYFDGEVPEAPASAWGPRGWPATGTVVALTGGAGNNGTITAVTIPFERAAKRGARRSRARTALRTSWQGSSYGGYQVADDAALRPASFTIEGRFRFDQTFVASAGYRGLVTKTTGVAWNDGWGLIEHSNSGAGQRGVRLFINAYGGGTPTVTVPTGREVHLCGTYDSVSQLAKLYVDGALVATSAATALVQVAQPIRIGHGYSGGYQHEGTTRDVRYYSRALTAEEVAARADCDADIDSGLIAAWAMDGTPRLSGYAPTSTSLAVDRVGGRNGTAVGTMSFLDCEDVGSRYHRAREKSERWSQPKQSGSLRTAIDASLAPGAGSFSFAADVRLIDGNVGNTNTIVTCFDDVSYANGWTLTYNWAADGTAQLSGYIGSAGPNANGSNVAQRVLTRNKTVRLAFVADAAAGTAKWYVDGKIISLIGSLAWNLANAPRLSLGLSPALSAAIGGNYADVRYAVGTAWTEAEIERDAAGDEDALSGVTHAWPLDDLALPARATKGPVALSLTNAGSFKTEPLGGTVESPRAQNLIPNSGNLLASSWSTTTATPVQNADGSWTITDSSAAAVAAIGPANNVIAGIRAGEVLVCSLRVLKTAGGTAPTFGLQMGTTAGNTFVRINTDTGLVTNLGSPAIYSVGEKNGWWEVVVTVTTNAPAVPFVIAPACSANSGAGMPGGDTVATTGSATVRDVRLSRVRPSAYVDGPVDVGPPDIARISITGEGFLSRPNLHHYMVPDAELITLVSGAVSDVVARVGGQHWAQSIAGRRPTVGTGGLDGKPYLLFDGVDDGFVIASAALAAPASDWLIAAVVDASSATGSQTILDSYDATTGGRVLVTHSGYATSGKTSWYDGTWREPSASVTGPQLLVWDLRAGRGDFYRNGVKLGASYPYTPRVIDDVEVGLMRSTVAAGPCGGKLYDFMILRNHSDGDVVALHEFFSRKFPSLKIA